jgi:hypothetical protein
LLDLTVARRACLTSTSDDYQWFVRCTLTRIKALAQRTFDCLRNTFAGQTYIDLVDVFERETAKKLRRSGWNWLMIAWQV